jgi:hypothetical protein
MVTGMRYLLLVLIAAVFAEEIVEKPKEPNAYALQEKFMGTNFFNHFTFFTGNDPTNGYVNYVDYNTALSLGLIQAGSNYVIMKADDTNVATGRGRNSVRITSIDSFNAGLFIIDLTHMPTGCGTWPAFWLVGPNWPNEGEIDIIEGVDNQTVVFTTLHTSEGCSMCSESTNSFTGKWNIGSAGNPSCDCYINAPNEFSNQGCSIAGASNTMGNPFNKASGGVYATEWVPNSHFAMWFFPRNNIPSDITNGTPNPSSWGTPYAYFMLSSNCPSSHFANQQIVFDLTFCGDWDGSVFAADCPGYGSCQTFVQNNPKSFSEAYWYVNYVAVYQQ